MPDDGITITGQQAIDALMRRLRPENFIKIVVRASEKIGEQIKDRVAKYPGKSNSPVIWASRKSRAFYFAMRKAKGLPAKYTRTSDGMSQKLGQSWVVKTTPDGAIVGNPATYADLVQSEEKQSAQHAATGWITDAKAVNQVEESGIIAQALVAEIASAMRALGGT